MPLKSKTLRCPQCGSNFTTKDGRRRYCSVVCQRAGKQLLDDTRPGRPLWKISLPGFCVGLEDTCIYCGEEATEIDHLIPVSFLQPQDRDRQASCGPIGFSCKECNQILHDKYFNGFKDRVRFVQKEYLRRAEPLKKIPVWADEEIVKLDYTLQTYVAARKERVLEIDRKTAYPDSFKYRRLLKQIAKSHFLDPSHPKYNEFYATFFS